MYRYLLPLVLATAPVLLSPDAHAQTLRGSRASVDRMYRQAQQHDLHFYETSAGVRRAASRGNFVRLSGNGSYEVASVSHPYVVPAAAVFVERLASQYRSACGEKLVVTSAVRPTSIRLANSVEKSVHPTGMAIDLRKPTKRRCLSWLRETLLHLESAGVVEATEEYRPPHFHVAVFPAPYERYVSGRGGEVKLATAAPAPRSSSSSSSYVSAPSSEGAKKYKVRRGDSLWTIARRNRTSVETIKKANNLRGSRIVVGQVLLIPDAR